MHYPNTRVKEKCSFPAPICSHRPNLFTPHRIAKRRRGALARQVNEPDQQPQHTRQDIGPESPTGGHPQHVQSATSHTRPRGIGHAHARNRDQIAIVCLNKAPDRRVSDLGTSPALPDTKARCSDEQNSRKASLRRKQSTRSDTWPWQRVRVIA